MKQAAAQIGPAGVVAFVDVDQNPQAAQAFQVRGIPNLIVVKNGQAVEKISPMSADGIATAFQKHL